MMVLGLVLNRETPKMRETDAERYLGHVGSSRLEQCVTGSEQARSAEISAWCRAEKAAELLVHGPFGETGGLREHRKR
jgi:hypothetical protein